MAPAAMREWAERLVARARADGVSLIGEGGLLTDLTRQVLQTGLEVEMAEHLGYQRGAAPPGGAGKRPQRGLRPDGHDRDRRGRLAGPARPTGHGRAVTVPKVLPTARAAVLNVGLAEGEQPGEATQARKPPRSCRLVAAPTTGKISVGVFRFFPHIALTLKRAKACARLQKAAGEAATSDH